MSSNKNNQKKKIKQGWMEKSKISSQSIDSYKQQFEISTRNSKEEKLQCDLIRSYDYNCQLDQYNVKLCGVLFDVIGAPDFFVQNEVQNRNFDIFE